MNSSESVRCMICGYPASLYATKKDRLYPELQDIFNLYRCVNCALIFINPSPQKDVLEKHYPVSYTSYQPFLKNIQKTFVARVKKMAFRGALAYCFGYGTWKLWHVLFFPYFLRIARFPTYKKEGSVLDVGCGSGKFLYELKELGWKNVFGIDVSLLAVSAAKARGFDVRHGELIDSGYSEHSFDAVTFNHVFEHLGDPKKTLGEARRILKYGGELVITLPNTKGFLAQLFGSDWFGLEIPRHLYNYNRKNLERLLKQNGFEVHSCVSLKTLGTLVQSIGFKLGRLIKTNTQTFRIVLFCLRIIEFVLDIVLLPFYFGDELVIHAVRK